MDRGRGRNRGGGGGGRHYASRGRSPRPTGHYVVRRSPVVAHPDGALPLSGSSEIGRINSEIPSVDGVTKDFSGLSSSDYPHGSNAEPHVVGNMSPNNGNSKLVERVSEAENQTPKPLDLPSVVGPGYGNGFPSIPTHSELRGGNCGGRGGGRYYASRGRSPLSMGRNVVRRSPVVAHPDGASPGSGSSEIGQLNSEISSGDPYGPSAEPHGVRNMSPYNGNPKLVESVSEAENQTPKPLDLPSVVGPGYNNGFRSLPTHSELRGGNRGDRGGGRHYASRGRAPRSTGRYIVRHSPVVARPDGASPGIGSSEIGRINSEISSAEGVTKKINGLLSSDYSYGPNAVPDGVGNMSPNNENSELAESVSEAENQTPKPSGLPSVVGPGYSNDVSSLPTHSELTVQMFQSWDQDEQNQSASYLSSKQFFDATHKKKEPSQTMDCGFLDGQVPQESQRGKSTSEVTSGKSELEKSDHNEFSFDICEERNKNIPKLKTPLLVKNRAMRSEMKRQAQGVNIQTFRPGMILLKGYISLKEQVKLIKSCRDLGRGHGGFYQPGYRDGAKLHLKMMCLGKNWDPETSMYGDKRSIDDAKPPPIPDDFQQIVKEALQECHGYLESHSKVRNVRDILPSMSPNICIINFYTNNGKLGLHQDKDESQESIRKRLPVVSFSLGDSAEFLYGEQRDIDKADKVVLESGDVLVFGGESRLIFHGVSNIIPDTAPKPLLEETNLRPGRLNLTFREY